MRFVQRTWFVAVGNMPREKHELEIEKARARVEEAPLPSPWDKCTFDIFIPVTEGPSRLQVDELRFD